MSISTDNRNEAYKAIADKLPDHRRQVYETIRMEGPMRAVAVANHLGWPINKVTGRIHELKEQHCLIKEIGSQKSVSTNNKCTIYATVDPDEVPQLMEEKVAALQAEMEDLALNYRLTFGHGRNIVNKEYKKVQTKLNAIKSI